MIRRIRENTKIVKMRLIRAHSVIAMLVVGTLCLPAVVSCTVSVQVPIGPTYVVEQTTKEKLFEQVRERGWALIIVSWRMDDYMNVDQILDELKAKDLNISFGRTRWVGSSTSMSVDEDALIYLYSSEKVKRIDENSIGGIR
ncbi:MAG: hypothetical protein LAT67_13670 [Balneolales bacterium]|nr:hypothetical protein [Balneolales bacterium]